MADPHAGSRSADLQYPAPTHPEAALRAAGLRVTRPRVEVLRALSMHPHSSAGTVLGIVREGLGTVSTQAVYDVLHVLADNGLVRAIEPMGSVTRYELSVGDGHHHVVCRGCQHVADVPAIAGPASCLADLPQNDFLIDSTEVIFWGLCPQCQATPPPTTPRKNHDRTP